MKKFSIIDFQGDNGLETSIVPTIWIQMETGQCYWPDQGDSERAVINCSLPRDSWTLYPLTGIKYQTDEYPKAAAKLKLLLQGFSDIGSSTSEGGHQGNRRKRLIQRKRCMSSSDSDDNLPVFSTQPSTSSCVDENEPPQSLPTLQFTPYQPPQSLPTLQFTPYQPPQSPPALQPTPSTVMPRPASRPFGMLPQPRADVQPSGMMSHPRTRQPLRARSRPGRQPVCRRPLPLTSSPSMSDYHYSSEDHTDVCSGSLDFTNHTDVGSGSLDFTNSLLNRVLNKIEEQSELLQDLVQKVNQITVVLQNVGEETAGTSALPDGLSLPLCNEEELGRLEEELMDKGARTKLVQHLSCIGGDSVPSVARRILNRLFSPQLAQKFNFSGAKGKKVSNHSN